MPPVRQIKCFQLFSGDDGGASGVGSGVAAAWSFCLLGFGTDGGRIKLLVLRGDSVFSGDYFVPLRFFVDNGGVVSGQDRMRFGSFFSYAIGRKFLLPLGGLASWVVDFVGGASSLPRWEARDDDRCAPEVGCFVGTQCLSPWFPGWWRSWIPVVGLLCFLSVRLHLLSGLFVWEVVQGRLWGQIFEPTADGLLPRKSCSLPLFGVRSMIWMGEIGGRMNWFADWRSDKRRRLIELRRKTTQWSLFQNLMF